MTEGQYLAQAASLDFVEYEYRVVVLPVPTVERELGLEYFPWRSKPMVCCNEVKRLSC